MKLTQIQIWTSRQLIKATDTDSGLSKRKKSPSELQKELSMQLSKLQISIWVSKRGVLRWEGSRNLKNPI